jgi:proline iminopeptidase
MATLNQVAATMRIRLPLSPAIILVAACAHTAPPGQPRTLREGYLTTSDSARLFYRIAGHAGDTIIALHGGPGDNLEGIAEDFAPLTTRHTVVFYDQRGGGRSELPVDTTRLFARRQVEDLEEVRDQLGLERVTLVAHSYGALLAASYAVAHPSRVRRMVFFGPLPPRRGDVLQRFPATIRARLDAQEITRLDEAYRRLRDRGAEVRQACRDFLAVALLPRLAQPRRSLALMRSDLCASSVDGIRYGLTVASRVVLDSYGDWDLRQQLHLLDIPTLVMHGEEDAIPMELVAEWISSLRRGQLVRVPNAAHFPYLERPDLVWPAVDHFLTAPER